MTVAELAVGTAVPALSSDTVAEIVEDAISTFAVSGRRVLMVVPDRTRSGPLAQLRSLVTSALARHRAASTTWLVALGTHRPLDDAELSAHLGMEVRDGMGVDGSSVRNHRFDDPGALANFGTLDAALIAQLSGGRLREPVAINANAAIRDHDLAIVLGPVFPHEVVGFSGANKYFFPGISGREMIDRSHWLGALITSREIIGTLPTTPVRAMIDAAAAALPIERRCLAMVVRPSAAEHVDPSESGLSGLFAGTCEEAFAAASACSAGVHVRYVPAPYRRVVSLMARRYEDMWTAAKGMYKVEPIVADGGEVIIVAPHIREFSTVHGATLELIGYHCRDYFLGQWDRFSSVAPSVLAHSTHLRGQGSYDVATGREQDRIDVVLATGISPERCSAMNLGYRDPASLDLEALAADPETLVVPDAGEMLFRLEGER